MKYIIGVIIGLVLLMNAGCQKKIEDKVTIKVSYWAGGDEQVGPIIGEMLQRELPDINVKMEIVPWSGYKQKILTEVAGGSGSDIVMFYLGDFSAGLFKKDVCMALDSFIKDDKGFNLDRYFPNIIDACRYKGNIFGLPLGAFSEASIFYNKALFKKAGVPFPDDEWDWNDFLEKAQKLTLRDEKGEIGQYGFGAAVWRNFMYSNGGDEVDNFKDPKGSTLDSQATKEALQFYVDMVHKYKVAPPYYEQYQGAIDPVKMFMEGRLAMFNTILPLGKGFKNLEWDIARFPKGPRMEIYDGVVCGTISYAIMKTTRHPDEAWQVLKVLTGDIGQMEYAKAVWGVPVIREVAERWLQDSERFSDKKWLLKELDYGKSFVLHPKYH
ncbi:MAG: sugar ABC transporter substrate-binding protein, partial [Candidatus Omnitrophica bacterium]|nr:sugar ABC transporter substrate-binding protein [Candidatus Omnitrophota bacterium]